MKRIVGITLATVLVGCASTSDVVPTGNGTYLVSAHGVMGWSSGGEQTVKAMKRAEEFCKDKGMTFQTVSTTGNVGGGFGKTASGDVEFRCVKA